MKRQIRRYRWYGLGALACGLLLGIWLAACTRQEAPPAAAHEAPPVIMVPMDQATEEAAIRQVLHQRIDQGGATEKVDVNLAQVAIDSDYALVYWMHGDKGGQAVLHKEAGE